MNFISVVNGHWKEGFDGKRKIEDLEHIYHVVELREALTRSYDFDAFFVMYVVRGAERHCRINQDGLSTFPGTVESSVFIADVDNPEHGPWTLQRFREEFERLQKMEVLRTAGFYTTEHGYRIVQPLTRTIPVKDIKPYLQGWLRSLECAGIVIDRKASDWTRHFRAAHVRRKGRRIRSPITLLERMTPIDPDSIESYLFEQEEAQASLAEVVELKPRRRAARKVVGDWSEDVPGEWQEKIQLIADAIRDVTGEWHGLFLALTGALIYRGVPHPRLPAVIRAISVATGADTKTEERFYQAQYTLKRYQAGHRITGYPTLVADWPAVAEAVAQATATPVSEMLREQATQAKDPPVPDLMKAQQDMSSLYDDPRDGVTLIAAECGFGKSALLVEAAVRRSQKPFSTKTASGKRAPLGSKTAISVLTNALSMQYQAQFSEKEALCMRRFGPLSVIDPDGQPACKLHDVATPLVRGGQSMQWLLCEGAGQKPCSYYEACKARLGFEGSPQARNSVGPHALLPALAGDAGSTGHLVIDEPSEILESTRVSEGMLHEASSLTGNLDNRYAAAVAPAVLAALKWLSQAPLDEPRPLHDVMRELSTEPEIRTELEHAHGAAGVQGDVVDCVRQYQMPKGHHGVAPPLSSSARHRFLHKPSLAFAKDLGLVSEVFGTLYHRLRDDVHASIRVVSLRGKRTIVVTGVNERFAAAVNRQGATTVLDANADLIAPLVAKLTGYTPVVCRFPAADGSPIHRVLIEYQGATRTGWLRHGQVALTARFISAVRQLFACINEDPTTKLVGLVAMAPVELAIRAAWLPEDRAIADEWREKGWSRVSLDEVRQQLAPLVRTFQGDLIFGHYGAVRGLNNMAEADCVATLGDPWPNLGMIEDEVMFLGQPDLFDQRALAWCRAELEQAQGRIRPVHRKRPGRAIHLGAVLPSGYGWSQPTVELRPMPNGRPRARAAMQPDEFRDIVEAVGGVKAMARILGLDPKMIRKHIQGDCAVPEKRARIVRQYATPTTVERAVGGTEGVR